MLTITPKVQNFNTDFKANPKNLKQLIYKEIPAKNTKTKTGTFAGLHSLFTKIITKLSGSHKKTKNVPQEDYLKYPLELQDIVKKYFTDVGFGVLRWPINHTSPWVEEEIRNLLKKHPREFVDLYTKHPKEAHSHLWYSIFKHDDLSIAIDLIDTCKKIDDSGVSWGKVARELIEAKKSLVQWSPRDEAFKDSIDKFIETAKQNIPKDSEIHNLHIENWKQ